MARSINGAEMDTVSLRAPDGASALLSLHGGQLLSWQPAGGDEQLYRSPVSQAAPGVALRGGVPVIFPQFAAQGPGPRHGIARSRGWKLVQKEQGERDAMAVLRLHDDDETLRLWPHAFVLEMTVRLAGATLEMELAVENRGESRLSFQAALHSYWQVSDIGRVVIDGLQDRRYHDNLRQQEGVQHSRRLEMLVGHPVDRIVYGPATTLQLLDLGETRTRTLLLESEGFDDTVVWNPGPAHGLADLPPDDWRRFVCLEMAQIEHPPTVEPGEEWFARHRVTLG